MSFRENSMRCISISIAVITIGLAFVIQGMKAYLRTLSTHCAPTAMMCPHLTGMPDLILVLLAITAMCLGVSLLLTELFHQPKIRLEKSEPVFPQN